MEYRGTRVRTDRESGKTDRGSVETRGSGETRGHRIQRFQGGKRLWEVRGQRRSEETEGSGETGF